MKETAMKKQIWFVVLSVVILTLASCSPAQETPLPPTAVPNPTAAPSTGQACTSINLLYHERPPYAETSGPAVKGLTASPSASAFDKAGIQFKWALTPSKRELQIIQENQGCDCSVGWFKNPDREKFALYTSALYQDQPQIAIARANNDKIQSGRKVADVLTNPDLTLGVKDGYSYGKFLDDQIAAANPKKDVTTAENTNMLEKVRKGYNDYFFMAPEEADDLIRVSGFRKEDFKYITFSDMPNGEKRYIICSKRVGADVVEKLNQALSSIVSIP
jgi:ABC-type amino acid transport substrate-binding protein